MAVGKSGISGAGEGPSDEARLRVWVLLGARRGDNNQLLALAEALRLPFETKPLAWNFLYRLAPRWLPPGLVSLRPGSRPQLRGEPPDLVLALGRRSVPVTRWLRARSRGRTRIVQVGNPRCDPSLFDLVVTTPQYPVPDAANVLRLPVAMGPAAEPGEAAPPELAAFPAPRMLLLLGGRSGFWSPEPRDVVTATGALLARAEVAGGSLLVLPSPRTPDAVVDTVRGALAGARTPARLVPLAGPPSYRALLGTADEIFVTADSVSMISEALRTGRPVGLVPVRADAEGERRMEQWDRSHRGQPMHPRDLRFFWTALREQGLAGTVEEPKAGTLPDVAAIAAARVRRLLGLSPLPATGARDGARPE